MFAQHQARTPVSLMAAQRAVAALLSGELEHLLCVCVRETEFVLTAGSSAGGFAYLCESLCIKARGKDFQVKFLC